MKTAPNDIGRGLDWPPSNQKSLERGLMTRYLTVLSASYETYSNEPYNNSYLMNMLFVNRCGDIRKEYHTERPTETPLARPHSLKGCVTTTLICLRYGWNESWASKFRVYFHSKFLNKIAIYIVFRTDLGCSTLIL